MITFWALCARHAWIRPLLHSTTPSSNSVFIYLATSNFNWTHCGALTTVFLMLFDGCYFLMAEGTPYSGERCLVNAQWTGCCSAPGARFLLSRKMMVRHENMPLPYSNTIENINISSLKIFHLFQDVSQKMHQLLSQAAAA